MTRSMLLILPFLFACKNGGTITPVEGDTGLEADTGDTADTGEIEDVEIYEESTLRIIAPASGTFLPWAEPANFQAELLDAEGQPIDFDGVEWSSGADPAWEGMGLDFWNGDLDVGLHDITAKANLPNGDRVAHTVGGVLVQSPEAGTYVGLFISSVTYDGIPVPCSGAATLVVDPYADVAQGSATCIANLMGFEMEFNYNFDLANHGGRLVGTAGADILGWFEYDFDASGELASDEIGFEFGGDVMGMMDLEAEVRAEKISDDAGL